MDDDHVLCIVDDTLTTPVKFPDQVDDGPRLAGTVDPRLAEHYRFAELRLLFLN